MGAFAGLFRGKDSFIPEDKKKEFAKRIELLYQAGGMMEVEQIRLYGTKVLVIRKAKMREEGMDFFYNYFEDDYWETVLCIQTGSISEIKAMRLLDDAKYLRY